eukprot:scaffold263329_cov18-Tisochrysis_lutea.AAC.1
MEKQVQATELAMLVQQQAELKRGISIADNALAKSKADVAQLTGRVTHLAQQLQHAHEVRSSTFTFLEASIQTWRVQSALFFSLSSAAAAGTQGAQHFWLS